MKKLTLKSANTGDGEDRTIATLTLNAKGHVVCDPPDALDGVLRDGHLDLAARSLTFKDGAAFLQALSTYPLGGYIFSE